MIQAKGSRGQREVVPENSVDKCEVLCVYEWRVHSGLCPSGHGEE